MPRITSRRGSQRAAGSLVWWTIIASSLAVLLAGCAATLPEGEYYCGKSDLQVQDERLPARDRAGADPVGPVPGNISYHRCLYPQSRVNRSRLWERESIPMRRMFHLGPVVGGRCASTVLRRPVRVAGRTLLDIATNGEQATLRQSLLAGDRSGPGGDDSVRSKLWLASGYTNRRPIPAIPGRVRRPHDHALGQAAPTSR